MSTSALQDCLADLRDRQLEAIAIVATAGTTDFGSIDALPEIARIASENKIWLHVDAAYGGALLLSETHRARLAGLSQANSVTIDFHKAFFQPISCSAFLVADADHFRFIRVHADYLNPEKRAAAGIPDLVTNSVLTTRRFDALKIWLSLNTLGQREFGRMIDRLLVLASFTAEQIMATECLELLHQPTLGCIIFRFVSKHNPEAVDEINRSIQTRLFNAGEAVLGQTVVGGHAYIQDYDQQPVYFHIRTDRLTAHDHDDGTVGTGRDACFIWNMMGISILLALSSASFAIGGLCMKLSAGLTRLWPSMCVFLLFCTGAGLQAVALRRTELGVAYIFGSRG